MMIQHLDYGGDHLFCSVMALFARSTSPGLGYGRCWNSGPDAVMSTPVLASPRVSRPVDQVPLFKKKKKLENSLNTRFRGLFSYGFGEVAGGTTHV